MGVKEDKHEDGSDFVDQNCYTVATT